jgi:hypothetical protein
MGPWIEGCVPDSIRYVPGLRGFVREPKVSAVIVPAATSVENDCTRGPCAGGVPLVRGSAMGHVTDCALLWSGLGVVVLCVRSPRPPPNWPTITSEVGILYGVVLPVGVNERLFVRLIVRTCPMGTVITTGDHPAVVVAVAAGAAGFRGRQPGPVRATVPQV